MSDREESQASLDNQNDIKTEVVNLNDDDNHDSSLQTNESNKPDGNFEKTENGYVGTVEMSNEAPTEENSSNQGTNEKLPSDEDIYSEDYE